MKGLQIYWSAAALVGAVGGAAHGYKRSQGGFGATFKDAAIGAIVYPLAIPVIPLTAFMPQLLAPTPICKNGKGHGQAKN